MVDSLQSSGVARGSEVIDRSDTSRVEKWLSLIWLELEKGREDIRHWDRTTRSNHPEMQVFDTRQHLPHSNARGSIDDTHCTIFLFGCT